MDYLRELFHGVDFANVNATTAISTSIFVFLALRFVQSRRRSRSTQLRGPPSNSFIFGVSRQMFESPDIGALHDEWEKTYGPVYQLTSTLNSKLLVLGDPKAVAHFFAKDTSTYHQTQLLKALMQQGFGDVLLAMEGETHKRQRRALSTAFSNSAIRNLTSVFLDSAYKLKAAWDTTLQSSEKDSAIIEVQHWMNCISLDSVGNGGFSHDFGSLKGQTSPLAKAFDAFGEVKPTFSIMLVFLFGPRFPHLLARLPNPRAAIFDEIIKGVRAIAGDLLENAAKEREAGGREIEKSIVGALIKAENASSNVHMSLEEIISQIHLLMIAGYETTAVTLTWSLIELSRHPEIQERLRAEVLRELENCAGPDPTYDELGNGFHYLDAFVSEILRLHPALPEINRVAQEDNVLPLTNPIRTASGELVDSIFVAKGSAVRVSIAGMNKFETLWGEDAAKFDPERWLGPSADGAGVSRTENLKGRAAEIQGYKHLLTFAYGPRMCLGRNFALTEVKTVLTVLIRNFTFELQNGPATKIDSHRGLLPRPKVAGEEGPKVPLVVKRVE